MKHLFPAILLAATCRCLAADGGATAADAAVKYEARAVWLTTLGGLDWPHTYARGAASIEQQKAELDDILDRLQAANINIVLLQTRIRGTVIYPSQYEPWDACMSGQPGTSPGYDPLQYAIDACHRRGMQLHAWVVAIPLGKWDGAGCKALRKRRSDIVRRIGADGFINPEKSAAADYIAEICAEIATRYDVDGIHLDYIRYPDTWKITVAPAKGRDYITSIVRRVALRVKSIKPWIIMSCSPVGKHDDLTLHSSRGWNARSAVCQDAQAWLREGLMDALFPMMYFRDNQFYPFAIDWAQNSYGRIVAPGLGIYFMSPKEKNWPLEVITGEMQALRSYGMGHAYFRSRFFTDDTKGIYRYASTRFTPYPALVPPLTWESDTAPQAPYDLDLSLNEHGQPCLSWQHVSTDTTMTMYNVYTSRSLPVDIDDAANLVATRVQAKSILVPHSEGRHYAVTAINRYGNESLPARDVEPSTTSISARISDNLLTCDGRTLHLPKKSSVLSADRLVIETVQGRLVTVIDYIGDTVDVSRLDEGVYVVRSLWKKKTTHRLGYFAVRRSF